MDEGAEPVVLVPGLGQDARVFLPQIVALSRLRAVHVAAPGDAAQVEDMARALLAQAPPRFAIAGHGLGGAVALEVQRRAPERVTRIALIATEGLAETKAALLRREEIIVAARAGRLDEAVRRAVPSAALARPEIAGALVAMAMDLGPEGFVRQCRALQKRPDQQRVLRALRIPTLILGGMRDTICPPRRQEFLAALSSGARRVTLDEAGHVPMLEAPEAVSAALGDWLARQPPLILRHSLT